MKINISKLLREQERKIEFSGKTECPADLYGTEFTGDAEVSGYVLDQAGYMTLKASAKLPYRTSCARCSKPLEGVYELQFSKPVAAKGVLQNEENDEYVVAVGGEIDFDELLEDAVILDFPMRMLCKEDCKGLCPRCGKDLNEGKCGCPEKEIDPRLAKLSKLLDK